MITRANIGWWVYVATTLALGYGQMIRKIMSDTGGMASRFGPAVAVTVISIGIVATLLNKPILRQGFWKAVFVLIVFSSIVALGFALYLLLAQNLVSWTVLILMGGAVYLVPGEIKLHRYAFGSEVLWGAGSVSGSG